MDFDIKFLNKLQAFADNSPWKDDTLMEEIVEASERAFNEMSQGCLKEKFFCRLCGQSGSGKTTQLLESIQPNFKLEPAILAVRKFVKYHPQYDELVINLPQGELREYTNGFALKCLFLTLCRLLEQGFAVLYDVTLLEPRYEELLHDQLVRFGYVQLFNILSVPLEQSKLFITKRQTDMHNKEHGRIIAQKSIDYFYVNLETGLDYYIKRNDGSPAIIWTAYDKYPVYIGQVKNCKEILLKYRKNMKGNDISEKTLLRCKREFYAKYLFKEIWKDDV